VGGDNKEKTILINFDEVLTKDYGKCKEHFIPEPVDGVKGFIEELSKYYKVVLHTARNLFLVNKWLEINGLVDYITDVTNSSIEADIKINKNSVSDSQKLNNVLNSILGSNKK